MSFLSELVSFDTSKDENLAACSSLLEKRAKRLGLGVEKYDSKKIAGDGVSRPNFVFNLKTRGEKTLVLVTHYDVVPAGGGWKTDPFKAKQVGGKIFGRGACDDKGAVASCFEALENFKEKSANVKLVVVCDEERGGRLGMQFLASKTRIAGDAQLVVDGEPFCHVGSTGAVFGKVFLKGKGGHASRPQLANNPINPCLMKKLSDFAAIRAKSVSRFNAPPGNKMGKLTGRFTITSVNAGVAPNVIPEECAIGFDMRLVPEEREQPAIRQLGFYLKKIAGQERLKARMQIISGIAGFWMNPSHPFARLALKEIGGRPVATLGSNDGAELARKGMPTVIYGPLRRGTNFHGPNEFVYENDLQRIKRVVKNIAQALG